MKYNITTQQIIIENDSIEEWVELKAHGITGFDRYVNMTTQSMDSTQDDDEDAFSFSSIDQAKEFCKHLIKTLKEMGLE